MARYTQLQENEIREIASDYDLSVMGFESIEGGAGDSSYLLHTRQGSYVLTVFEITPAHVVRMGRPLVLLAEYGFPTSRLLAPTKGGMVTVYLGKPVILKRYIVGQECKDLDEAMLRQIGMAMARLHQVPAPGFLPDEHSYFLDVVPDVSGRKVNLEYESWLSRRLASLGRFISPELPRGLIHGDLFYDNVLFEGKEFKAIIDFECACRYYKAFDLGMGIVGLCAEGSIVALDKARALVAGYQQIRILGEREKEALQLFAEYAATATSAWRLRKHNIVTPNAEKADRYRQMVRLAEEIGAIPKSRFLRTVFNNGTGL